MMKGKLYLFGALVSLLSLFMFAVMPARADGVDDKIKALEDELSQLKTQQQQVRSEQMELRKEATAAAAALPTFSYRPGSGVTIAAADRSWSLNFSYEFHVHMYNPINSDAHAGLADGDLFFRRNRPYFTYCWADCFYEIVFGLDMDTGDIADEQNTVLYVHMENMNPYFPTVFVGDKGGQTASYVGRSSSSSAIVELARDMLADSDIDTLSHRSIGMGWIDAPLGSGDFLLDLEYKPGAGVNKNVTANTDRKQFFLKAGTRPFRKLKNKWIRGIKFGFGLQTDSVDPNSGAGNNRLRLRTTGDRPHRLSFFDTGTNIGSGMHYNWQYGLEWVIGPYTFRSEDGYASFANGSSSNVKGTFWSIAHELFLWSPKGFLTGSSSTAGSVLVGWQFLRADASCPSNRDCVPGASLSSQNHLIQRQLAAWYFIRPRLSVGTWWNWFSSPNTPTGIQEEIGCSNNPSVGKDCNYYQVNLGLRMNF
jgi:hypothetical protein